MKKQHVAQLILLTTCLYSLSTFAGTDTINVNNNNNNTSPQQSSGYACPPANQNNIYDLRVPPAGVYQQYGTNGSSSTTYTTGEKKPYITDNNCNSNNNIYPIVPYSPK